MGSREREALMEAWSRGPCGPWPNSRFKHLVGWLKLEQLEYECKAHGSRASVIHDSTEPIVFVCAQPFEAGSTEVEVKAARSAEERIEVIGRQGSKLLVRPTPTAGTSTEGFQGIKAAALQSASMYQPLYHRNVLNWLPSIKFSTDNYMYTQDNSMLARRLSGDVKESSFSLFVVSKSYTSQGNSPWPIFTLLDSESGWKLELQVAIEQSFDGKKTYEPRFKLYAGKQSCVTEGVDPTKFSIALVQKVKSDVFLYVNGCKNVPSAHVNLSEAHASARFTHVLFGLDADGRKYFDGEIVEFLAFAHPLKNSQVDQVGRYLARKFELEWSWTPRRKSKAVRSERHEESEDLIEEVQPTGGARTLASVLRSLYVPELSIESLERLAEEARSQQKRRFISSRISWDILFDFLGSSMTLLKTSCLKLLYILAEDGRARQEVARRDGMQIFLGLCEPHWKEGLQSVLNAKQEYVRSCEEQISTAKAQLDKDGRREMAALLRNKSVLKQAELMLEEALAEVEGVTKRMETGNEQRNIQAMIRESVNMIRALCEREEEECESFLEQGGIEIVMRVLLTPNIPIQTSICALSSALVKHEKVAKQLVARGLAAGLIDFMLVDDPHLQLEAATAVLRMCEHKSLCERMVELRVLPALGNLLSSSYDDSNAIACEILKVLAAYNDELRSQVAEDPSMMESLVRCSDSKHVSICTRAVRALSFLALNDQALEQLHQHHISLRDFAAKNDSSLTTSALMLLLNASRHMRYARKMLDRELVDELVKLGVSSHVAQEHLVCGVLANLCLPPLLNSILLDDEVLNLLIDVLRRGTYHARYFACKALKRLSWTADHARKIVSCNGIPPLLKLASSPRELIFEPDDAVRAGEAVRLDLHMQASRVLAALAVCTDVHVSLVKAGGLTFIVGLCKSKELKYCREGANTLANIAEVRADADCMLQMVQGGAIEALQDLKESPDDFTGAEAIRALSFLLNFDSGWAE